MYKVESIHWNSSPMRLVDIIAEHFTPHNPHNGLDSVAKEYWVPAAKWGIYELRSLIWRVIDIVPCIAGTVENQQEWADEMDSQNNRNAESSFIQERWPQFRSKVTKRS